MRSVIASAILVAALAASESARAAPPSEATGSGVAPARDGNIAIRQELDAARQAGTVAAYDLFIARHPAHPLAATARRERARLPAPSR